MGWRATGEKDEKRSGSAREGFFSFRIESASFRTHWRSLWPLKLVLKDDLSNLLFQKLQNA